MRNHRQGLTPEGFGSAAVMTSLLTADIEVSQDRLSAALANRLLRVIDQEIVWRGIKELAVRAQRPPPVRNANHAVAVKVVLRHAQLQAVGNWIQSKVDERLAKLEDGLASEVETADLSKLDRLFKAAEKRIDNTFAQLTDDVESDLRGVAAVLHKKTAHVLAQHHGAPVPQEPAHGGIEDTSVLGATVEEHFEKLAGDTLFKFKAAVRTGIEAGESAEDIAKRVKGEGDNVKAAGAENAAAETAKKRLLVQVRLMDSVENSINKVIQAALTAFGNEVQSRVVDDAETEKKLGYQWVAVLDERTCEQCEFYDGSQWDEENEPVGDGPEYPGDAPLHYNCRCAVVPVDLEGEPVPDDQSFDDYLSQFSRSEQEETFGKLVLRQYHRGDITAGQLVGQRSNLMSLEQFKEAD